VSDLPHADVSAFRRAAAALAAAGEGLDPLLAVEASLDAAAEVALPALEATPFGTLPEVPAVSGSATHLREPAPERRTARTSAPTPPAPPTASAAPAARERADEDRPVFPVARGKSRRQAETAASGDVARPAPSAAMSDANAADAPRATATTVRAPKAPTAAATQTDSIEGDRGAPESSLVNPSRRRAGDDARDGSRVDDGALGHGGDGAYKVVHIADVDARGHAGDGDGDSSRALDSAAWADPAALVAAILSIEAANAASAGDAPAAKRATQPWRGAVRAFRGAGRGFGAMPDAVGGLGASDAVLAAAETDVPLLDASPFEAVSADAVPQPGERASDRRRADPSARRPREWPEPPVAPSRRTASAPDAPTRDRLGVEGHGRVTDSRSRAPEPISAPQPRGAIAPTPTAGPDATVSDARPVHRLGRRGAARDASAGSAAQAVAPSGSTSRASATASPAGRDALTVAGPGSGSSVTGIGGDPLASLSAVADEIARLEPASRTLLGDLSEAVLRVGRGEGRVGKAHDASTAGRGADGEAARTRGAATSGESELRRAARRRDADEPTRGTARTRIDAPSPSTRNASSAVSTAASASAEGAASPARASSSASPESRAEESAGRAADGRVGSAQAGRVGKALRLVDTLARSILAQRFARDHALAAQLARRAEAEVASPDRAVRGAAGAPEIGFAPEASAAWAGHEASVGNAAAWRASAPDAAAHAAVYAGDPAAAALEATAHGEASLPAPVPVARGVAKPHGAATGAWSEAALMGEVGVGAALDAGALASLVNDALVEQALRHGVDLS
jgi:hypothetical protein